MNRRDAVLALPGRAVALDPQFSGAFPPGMRDLGYDRDLESVQAAAQTLGVKILPVEARTPEEIDNGFSLMRQRGAGGLIVLLQPLFQQQKSQIAGLAVTHRLPSMTADQMYAEAGCLMSYGSSLAYTLRRVATYVDKILKGAKPADLPVEQPTKFELIVNLKTARALGVKVPQAVLLRADRVLE